MIPSNFSIKTLRIMRSNGGRFSIVTRNNVIVDKHPSGIKQNTIRSMRKHGYVQKVHPPIAENTHTFELTRKAYDLLDNIEWTPVPVRTNYGND